MDTTTTTTAPPADPEAVRLAITNLDPGGVIGAQLDCVVAAVITNEVEDSVPGAVIAVIAAASPGQVPSTPDTQRFVQFAQQAAHDCPTQFRIAIRPGAAGNVILFEAP